MFNSHIALSSFDIVNECYLCPSRLFYRFGGRPFRRHPTAWQLYRCRTNPLALASFRNCPATWCPNPHPAALRAKPQDPMRLKTFAFQTVIAVNHQTHHRGQALILTTLGQASLQLDLIALRRTEEGRAFA